MTITDPTVLPVGTPAIVNYDSGDRNVWFHKGGGKFVTEADLIEGDRTGVEMTKGGRTFTPLVEVPDGMTVEDAQQALTEHVAWVPRNLLRDPVPPPRVRARSEWDADGLLVAQWVHRDDVPTDPDAELIDSLAAVLWGKRWDDVNDTQTRDAYLDKARAALAVVREHEATR